MKVSELRQAAKLLQITLSRNLVKQEIVDRILLQAQPQQLDSVIQKASHDCNSKQNDMTTEELADHNRKRANEWYKKTKQKQDAESVHDNRAQAQQKRRAAEKEKKATQSAQHLEALKQCDPNNPIHSQPLADKNIRQFDKEKSHLMVNICPLCKQGRITKMARKHQKKNYFSETQCTTCAAFKMVKLE